MTNTFKDLYRQITDVLYVHLLWVFMTFLGVFVTFGASTTALYKVLFQIFKVEEPTHVTNLFFKTFKEEFKESTCVWLLIALILTPMIFMLLYAIQTETFLLLILSIVGLYMITMFTIYVFPIIAIFKSNSILSTIRNTILIQSRHMLTNIKLVGSFGLLFLGFIYLPSVFILLIVPLSGFLVAFHLKAALNPYVEKLTIKTPKGDDYALLKL